MRANTDRQRVHWISETERAELNTLRARIDGPEPQDEVEHFYVCEGCGQAVDMRRLGDVLYHDQIEHIPSQVN